MKITNVFTCLLIGAAAFTLHGCGATKTGLTKAISGASPTATPPIIKAAKSGDTNAIRRFLDSGSDVNQAESDGDRAIHEAARNGHVKSIELLLARGADVEAPGKNGYPAIVMAAANGHVNVIKVLLSAGASPNTPSKPDGFYPIIPASTEQNDPEVITLLLAAGADANQVNPKNIKPIYQAAANNNNKVIDALVAAGAEVNIQSYYGSTPLSAAALQGHTEAVKSLLAAGANPNMTGKYGNTPLYLAALSIKKKDTFDVMRYLIAAGADVNVKQVKYEQETPLHAAVRKNHNNRVKLLLEAGANPKLRTSKGETPYDIASRYGHGQQIEGYLTSYGGGPNQDSQNNNSFG